jgi:hypothetical protein
MPLDFTQRHHRNSGYSERRREVMNKSTKVQPPANSQAALVDTMYPVATTLVVIYAVVGGILVLVSAIGGTDITQELRLSFKDYLEQMAIAGAALSVGRGLTANAKKP